MVAINNNIGDKFKIINSNLPSEKTDELFAELFALMNLENLDTIDKNPLKDKKPLKDIVIQQLNTKTNQNTPDTDAEDNKSILEVKENKLLNSSDNQNELELAKSLIEVFYKEIGIVNPSNVNINLNKNDIKVTNHLPPQKNLSNNLEIIKENQETSTKFDIDVKQNKSQNFVINIIKEPSYDKKSVKVEKNFEYLNQIKIQSNAQEKSNPVNNQPIKNSLKTNTNHQSVLLNKKINKKNKQLKNISKERIEGSEFLKKNIQNDSKIINNHQPKNQKLGDNQFNLKKELNNKNEIKINENKELQTINKGKDFLDLLESSWGEKFSKIVKNSINNGLNKLEIQIKPKNLGKLNLEVSVKNNVTSINIGSENQEVVSLLNDNLPKLLDLIDKESKSFSSLMSGENNQNNYFNDKKNKDDFFSNNQISKKKKNTENNNKISNHNIDVNA